MRLLLLAATWLALLVSSAFAAGDPIMPLDQVQRGMQCEGRSVFRGTAIEPFNVEVLDVIAANAGAPAGILIRAYGPNIDQTGMGFGFSGSPIYCPDADGVLRVVGAVATSTEDYGNDVALATPIEDMLDLPVSAARAQRGRPLSLIMVSGVGSPVRAALIAAARKHGLTLMGAPAASSQVTTGTDLQPGSAVAASMSSGDVGLGAIGTVTYRDGNRIWAFGHPLEAAGRRSLILQGAFVHAVIGNPNPPGFEGLGTYKLASAGDTAGVMDFDGNAAISGLLGQAPPTIPLKVVVRSGAGGTVPTSNSAIADESALNHPNGFPAMSLVTSIAVSDQAYKALRSGTGAAYGRMCLRFDLRERQTPMHFCNRYVGDSSFPGGVQAAMGGDATSAASLVETYDREQLHVEGIRATIDLAEGQQFARLRGVSGPGKVSPGRKVHLRISVQKPRQKVRHIGFDMRVPRTVKPGRRTLRLTGSEADPGSGGLELLFGAGFSEGGSGQSPSTVAKLAKAVANVHRYDGIRATFRKPPAGSEEDLGLDELLGLGGTGASGRPVYRDPDLRIGGSVKLRVKVVR